MNVKATSSMEVVFDAKKSEGFLAHKIFDFVVLRIPLNEWFLSMLKNANIFGKP